jgi:hypothetical protein
MFRREPAFRGALEARTVRVDAPDGSEREPRRSGIIMRVCPEVMVAAETDRATFGP